MYRAHFGLTRHPFAKDIPPEELFVSQANKELEVRLGHLIDLRGIGLITGDSGSGKTTICRKVTAGLHCGLHRVFYIPNSTGNVMDLYKSIAWELGLPTERSRAALYRTIRTEVMRLCVESHLRPLLFIDEAHHLRSDVLEELRFLTNYDMDSQNRLCLVFVGRPSCAAASPWPYTRRSTNASSCAIISLGSRATSCRCISRICCAAPAPSCRSSSPPPSRPSTRPAPASRARSTRSRITPSTPPPSHAPRSPPPSTCRPPSSRSRDGYLWIVAHASRLCRRRRRR